MATKGYARLAVLELAETLATEGPVGMDEILPVDGVVQDLLANLGFSLKLDDDARFGDICLAFCAALGDPLNALNLAVIMATMTIEQPTQEVAT
ncbi:MAG: hypothetical protein V2A79_19905 [Planctomycetota bacterium]